MPSVKESIAHGLPEKKVPILKMVATPAEANKGGSIFGGWLMAQADIAASIPAEIFAQGAVVTKAVTQFEFKKRLEIGDLLSFYADIIKVGQTSLTIDVSIHAQSIRNQKVTSDIAAQGIFVFVAIDEQGKPRKLPS